MRIVLFGLRIDFILFDMAYNFFEVEIEANVATVWLNNPEKRNLMNSHFWSELPEVIKEVDDDNDVHAILIAARGKSFSLGLDIEDFAKTKDFLRNSQTAESRLQLYDFILELQKGMNAVANAKKPVICAVQKHCYGGGLDLAAACDIRLCSKDARFSIFEVRVAIVADMGSIQRLPYIIGQGATRELAYTGEIIGAEKAEKIGLVNQVFDDYDSLLKGAKKMAATIATHSPFVVQGIKHVLDFSQGLSVDESMKYVATYNSAFLHSTDFIKVVQERMAAASDKK